MAIPFNPPEWLIKEYYDKKSPAEEASQGIQTALQSYLALDESKRKNALAESQLALEKERQATQNREMSMREREMFYNYGDPTYLPQDVQQQMNSPAQGPSYPANQPLPEGVQGPENQTMVGPQKSPIIQHFEGFLKENPYGIKGQNYTEDTILQKDQQGNVIGQSTVKRPIRGKTLMTGPGYQAQRLFTPQKTDLVDPTTGLPLQFTPGSGYEIAPTPGGIAPTPRKGDESAVTDANLIAQQAPNVDKLFDSYAQKSRLGSAAQASPLGYVLDPAAKQVEDSLKLAAFTFGGKNLTGQEKEVVFGALFPKITDNQEALNNKRQLLKGFFSGKIDLLQAANLLGPAGAPLQQMLQQKMNQGGSTPSQSAPTVGSHFNGEKVTKVTRIN